MSWIDLGRAMLVALLVPAGAAAQLQVSAITGTVLDTGRHAVVGAAVVLQDSTGTTVATRTSAADGSFKIADVAPGAYVIRVELQSTVLLSKHIVVRGSLPVELVLQVGPSLQEDVVVRGDAGALTAEEPASIAVMPCVGRRNHCRGTVSRVLWCVCPASWRKTTDWSTSAAWTTVSCTFRTESLFTNGSIRLFGIPPSASAIASLHVLDAYIPPEFGFKSGGVVEVRSQTGLDAGWTGTFDAGVADMATGHAEGAASGPLSRAAGLMITASHERSDRFLDPVDPDNLHNQGWAAAATTQFTLRTTSDLFTVSAQGGRNGYDVPHDFTQEQARPDQRQRMAQLLGAGSWQRIVSDRTVWEASVYGRHGAARLMASPNDTPVTSMADRSNDRGGLLWSLTHQRARHTAKAGFEVSALSLDEQFSFAVTDPDAAEDAGLTDAAIAHDPAHPFVFADRRHPSLWSVFVQDVYRASNRLTVNLGVRFDRSHLLIASSQWSPRAASRTSQCRGRFSVRPRKGFSSHRSRSTCCSHHLKKRANCRRSRATRSAAVRACRRKEQTALDLSLSQDLSSHARVNLSVWRRRARDVGDPNVFFGTTLTVPNSVVRQHAWGIEARLDLAPYHGWSGALSYTHARVDQFGPFTGGLFLEEEVAEIQDGTRFTPDHDQRHAVSATLAFGDDRRRWRAAGNVRYQTGTPVGLDDLDEEDIASLRERRGVEVVDFASGRVRPYAITDLQAEWRFMRRERADVSATLWLNNITNAFYAFNFGNAFSGTHFGSGRRVGVNVRLLFRR
jgi:hypothetical protein